MARQVEAAGIPTLCMSSALDITRTVNPPRAAFLDYPLGHTTGEPDQPELQRMILIQALDAFTSLREPGSVKMLPFQWSKGESWKDTGEPEGFDRQPRHPTPQYQTEDDRQRAEGNDLTACHECEVIV